MTCPEDRQEPKFLLIIEETSNVFKLELGRGQICTKLNPCAFSGVRDNSMTVYADVREFQIFTSLIS